MWERERAFSSSLLSGFRFKSLFPLSMEPCRYDMGCWRPLCPFRHSGRARAARWAVVWALIAQQEQSAELPVPLVVEEILEVAEHIHQERIFLVTDRMTRPVPSLQQSQSLLVKIGLLGLQSTVPRKNPIAKCSATQNVGVPVPHVVKEIPGVIKDVPQERTPERTALRAPKRRNRQRNRHCELPVSDPEDELGARLRGILPAVS